ncbi:phospholipase D-like domain-containing protein [Salegentibacter sp. F14]
MMKSPIFKSLFFTFLLTLSLSCSKDEPSETEIPDKEVPSEVEAIDFESPDVTFNNVDKILNGEDSYEIVDHMTSLLNAATEGSTVHIAVFAFHDLPGFFSTLKRTAARGVQIKLMMDFSDHGTDLIENNSEYADALVNVENVELVKVNNTAGAIAINHNKFMLFSEIETIGGLVENVVHQSSHNYTAFGTRKVQDAVTLTHTGLYEAYKEYWEDMKKYAAGGMENYEYREFHDEAQGVHAYFYPRRNGGEIGSDNVIDLLDEIDDLGNAIIKIGMSGWSASRSSIIDKLQELEAAGAKIQIVTKSNIASSIQDRLATFAKRDNVDIFIFDMSQRANIHSKFMLIEGAWKGTDSKFVWTGSQNFTNNAYKYNNETSLILEDPQVYDQYNDYFESLKEFPVICCSGEENIADSTYAIEDFDSYTLNGETMDIDGLGGNSNGWGGPWEQSSGKFLIAEGNLPEDDSENAKHAYTIQAGDDKNINYYRMLAGTWENTANASYWLGFQFSPKQVGTWAGLGLYKDGNELLIIGTPYKTQKQGIGGMSEGRVIIEDSKDTDKTWFVAKIEMKGPDQNPYLHVWRNPDPQGTPDIEDADVSIEWPDGKYGFNRIRIGNTWTSGASYGYDNIILSDSFADLVF